MFQKLFSRKMRPALATGLIVALLFITLTIPSIRAAAIEFLGLFRIQQIQVVEFNPANLPQNMDSASQSLERVLANELKVEEMGDPVDVADASEAASLAGFPVLLPAGFDGDTRLTVQPEATASFTVDLALWQGILDEMGRSDLKIPAELDGQTITFHANKSVTLAAGTCILDSEEYENLPRRQRTCTLLVQTPSPTIDAPPGLPINEIAQAGLQLLGMSAEEAAAFSAKIDWANTLLIPVPVGSEYQDVTVQGVSGTLFSNPYDPGRSQYALVWVKDGILYGLQGVGTAAQALDLANSLK